MGPVLRKEEGFTLIQLLVVVAVVAVLATIGSLKFNDLALKASIEKQQKMLFRDMMEVRLQALFEKAPRALKFSSKDLAIFPGEEATGSPVATRTLEHPIAWNGGGSNLVISYDTYGISNKAVTICVDPARDNPASDDCLVVSKTRVRVGKRASGKSCSAEYVALR